MDDYPKKISPWKNLKFFFKNQTAPRKKGLGGGKSFRIPTNYWELENNDGKKKKIISINFLQRVYKK